MIAIKYTSDVLLIHVSIHNSWHFDSIQPFPTSDKVFTHFPACTTLLSFFSFSLLLPLSFTHPFTTSQYFCREFLNMEPLKYYSRYTNCHTTDNSYFCSNTTPVAGHLGMGLPAHLLFSKLFLFLFYFIFWSGLSLIRHYTCCHNYC